MWITLIECLLELLYYKNKWITLLLKNHASDIIYEGDRHRSSL